MCGVIGVIGSPQAAKEAFLGLITLQHRGQDAAGILTYDNSFHLIKNIGLVENVFTKEAIETLTGEIAVGHTRYSTVGQGDIQEVQPLLLNYPYGIGMVHNGNIVNYLSIKERLDKEMRRRLFTHSDTEAVLNWFAHHLAEGPNGLAFPEIVKAVESVFDNVNGSFSIVSVIGGSNSGEKGSEAGLLAFRDPHGIRPLVLGKRTLESGKCAYMISSETIPLTFMGYEFERDIKPGELLFIDSELNVHSTVLKSKVAAAPRPCMFEWVYFAGAESEIDNTPVYGARLELGVELAAVIREKIKSGEISPDLVAPVPDTSRTAATALAEELKLPYREVLIKNRYIKRTFILGSQQKREKAVDLKLNPITSEIKGKNILLVDDSIVRGTTSKKIVELVRRAGAKEVYFVSTCPPIKYPCFYGIDFPDQNELISASKTPDEIAKLLGAKTVIFQNQKGLVAALKRAGLAANKKPCMACLDGDYPTDVSDSKRFTQLREAERQQAKGLKS